MAMKLFGKSKVQESKITSIPQPDSIPVNHWVCKKCGAVNSNSVLSCKDCGAYK